MVHLYKCRSTEGYSSWEYSTVSDPSYSAGRRDMSTYATYYGILDSNNSHNIYAVKFVLNSETGIYEIEQIGLDPLFQVAPQEGATTTILTTMITSQDLSGVIKEILGLLPMILAILITLLGLMKAIRLLYRVLVQS